MGFFSGMTPNGLLEVLGRMARSGGGPFHSAFPASQPAGSALPDPLQPRMDQHRLALSQALLAGDFGAVSRMTEPLRRRRLAARERSTFPRELPSQELPREVEPYSAANLAPRNGEDGPQIERMPAIEQNPSPSFSKSDAVKSAGQDDPVTRQMMPAPEGEIGPGLGNMIVQEVTAPTKPPYHPENSVIERRILQEKLGRAGGLNGYGYIPSSDDVNLLARAAYSEFGEESNWPDLHAGVWAILNRVRPAGGYGRHRDELGPTLEEVLTRQGRNGVQQFPFMPRGGLNAPGGSHAWRRSARPDQMNPRERKAWELSVRAVKDVLSGSYPDPTAGASFYYNRDFAPPAHPPGWWATLRRSPYVSPNDENFFGQASEDQVRPLLTNKPSPYLDRRPIR